MGDELVSALDVSIQSQILNLLVGLQDRMGLSYLFISHDLSVVRHFCDEVIVMYLGRAVERARKEGLFAPPRHPYAKVLLSTTPKADPEAKRERIQLQGELPSQWTICRAVPLRRAAGWQARPAARRDLNSRARPVGWPASILSDPVPFVGALPRGSHRPPAWSGNQRFSPLHPSIGWRQLRLCRAAFPPILVVTTGLGLRAPESARC